MSIQPGQTLPAITLHHLVEGAVQPLALAEHAASRKLVLFAVPGAFTPTCSARHLPGFVEHHADFQAKGVDVACVAVNDAFVMDAWGKGQNVPAGLLMLADGNGELTRALGLELDATGFGMGLRSKRFALYAEHGVVKQVWVEAPGEFKVSAADHVLSAI